MIQTARHQYMIRSPEELQQKFRDFLTRRAERTGDPQFGQPRNAEEPLIAVIDWGRWIGHCQCGSGVAVEPEWPKAFCFECGRIYTDIQFPTEREQIEEILSLRRPENQHWVPNETVDELLAVNAEHGIGSR